MRLKFPKSNWLRAAVFMIPLLAILMSCSNLSYYWQSASGHMKIMSQREDIDDLLQKPEIGDDIKLKLELVQRIRVFASQQLALPDNDSYTQYVDIHRPYVVWNVFAAPEFSTELKQWCFLFVGCVGYRGYYNKTDATAVASEVTQKEKFETYVGGSQAYSTLGWFDDPVLSTFIHFPESDLAGLLFHELTHQMLYIKNDAAFNEGLANTVELEGVKRWLAAHPQSGDDKRYQRKKHVRALFIALLATTNNQLKQLYQQPLPEQAMREKKAAIIAQLKQQFEREKQATPDFRIYDAWFSKPINNAQLGSVAIYEDYVPAFQQLLLDSGEDLPEFYRRVKLLGKQNKKQRDQELAKLAQRHAQTMALRKSP